MPTATVSFEASNIISDTTVSGDGSISGFTGIESPAVNPVNGVSLPDPIQLPWATGNSHGGDYVASNSDTLSALRPGDLVLDLSNFDGEILSKVDGAGGIHIQSASLSLPLSRTPIERLGTKFPFARVVDFPVNASLTVNAIVNTMEAQNLAKMISGCGQETLRDVTVSMKECGQTT